MHGRRLRYNRIKVLRTKEGRCRLSVPKDLADLEGLRTGTIVYFERLQGGGLAMRIAPPNRQRIPLYERIGGHK